MSLIRLTGGSRNDQSASCEGRVMGIEYHPDSVTPGVAPGDEPRKMGLATPDPVKIRGSS